MLRITLLCLATGALAQLMPQGCSFGPAEETPPAERKTIITQASAPDDAHAGDEVLLTATATADIDGGTISYAWLQIGGLGVPLINASQATASFQAPSLPATQVLRFVVTTSNERGDAGQAHVDVNVLLDPDYGTEQDQTTPGDRDPTARAGADRMAESYNIVILDGRHSRGDELTYEWEQVYGTPVELKDADRARATFKAPPYQPEGENRLEFELEVRDRCGRSATSSVVIAISPAPRVRVETSRGDFTIVLRQGNAPLTVANFLEYVDDGFYDGTVFHRVIADFVVQGGGFIRNAQGQLEEKDTRDPIVNEASDDVPNDRATVAMARTNDPDSATSQFYVNVADNDWLNASGVGAEGYAVFGEVIEGMDVVDAIAEVETHTEEVEGDAMQDVPVEDVLLISIERLPSPA